MTSALAYCAGFFDGEGSISLNVSTLSPVYGSRKSFNLQIQATQKRREPLDYLLQIMDIGYVTLWSRRHDANDNSWMWQAGSGKATEALQKMLPYLIVKKDEAELAIKAWNCIVGGKRDWAETERLCAERRLLRAAVKREWLRSLRSELEVSK